MKALVIEDNEDILEFLTSNLPAQGFAVDGATTGHKGIALNQSNEYDVILLDLNLPDMAGEQVVKEIHKCKRIPPILVLTVISDIKSKVNILNTGADDYLSKPFSFEELLARIRALLRRSQNITSDIIFAGSLKIDVNKQTVNRGRKIIPLTRKEFSLLEYMARQSGRVVTKSSLIEHVWDSNTNFFLTSLDTHIANLRRKIGEENIILTVHGRGYMIK